MAGRSSRQPVHKKSTLCFDWKLGKIHGNVVTGTASNGYNVHKTSTPTIAQTHYVKKKKKKKKKKKHRHTHTHRRLFFNRPE